MMYECDEVKEELPRDLLDALKGATVFFFKLKRKGEIKYIKNPPRYVLAGTGGTTACRTTHPERRKIWMTFQKNQKLI